MQEDPPTTSSIRGTGWPFLGGFRTLKLSACDSPLSGLSTSFLLTPFDTGGSTRKCYLTGSPSRKLYPGERRSLGTQGNYDFISWGLRILAVKRDLPLQRPS